MVWSRKACSALALGAALQLAPQAGAAGAGSGQWVWPLAPDPVVVASFRPPAQQWGPGHRGVDLLGSVGQPVSAIGAGTISFAGVIAGRGVVVVNHGALRSTYEPVVAHVTRGQSVTAGQVIATLAGVHSHCAPRACLHLGVRRGDGYVDPLTLLGPRAVRLKPLTDGVLSSAPDGAGGGSGTFARVGSSKSGAFASGLDVGLTSTATVATAALAAVAADRRRRRRRDLRHVT